MLLREPTLTHNRSTSVWNPDRHSKTNFGTFWFNNEPTQLWSDRWHKKGISTDPDPIRKSERGALRQRGTHWNRDTTIHESTGASLLAFPSWWSMPTRRLGEEIPQMGEGAAPQFIRWRPVGGGQTILEAKTRIEKAIEISQWHSNAKEMLRLSKPMMTDHLRSNSCLAWSGTKGKIRWPSNCLMTTIQWLDE